MSTRSLNDVLTKDRVIFARSLSGNATNPEHPSMKKFITLLAFAGLMVSVNAQSTSTVDKEQAPKVEKVASCAGKSASKDGKACCAGKGDAKAEATAGSDSETMVDGKPAACCAGKAGASKSCHGAGAKADAGHAHDHAHGDLKEHACTDACKEGAHALACGEKGHACSADCHAKL